MPITNLSISAFRLDRSDFTTNLDVSIPIAFFKSAFVAELGISTLTLISPPNGSYGLGKPYLLIKHDFYQFSC